MTNSIVQFKILSFKNSFLQTCQKLGRDLFEEQKEMLKCETVGFLRKHQKVRNTCSETL